MDLARREQWLFLMKADGLFIPILIPSRNFSRTAIIEISLAHKVKLNRERGTISLEDKKKPSIPYIS